MNLQMPADLGATFRGPTQKARVVTESWMAQEGYCPSCLGRLSPMVGNFRAIDYECSQCRMPFQLKSTKSRIGNSVPDGAYETMIQAIRSDRSPAFVLMRYDLLWWTVRELFVVPAFALTEQAILPRKPLASTARRAGWVGCNIALNRIAPDVKVPLVENGIALSRQDVCERFVRLMPLRDISVRQRGWALAVLNGLQRAGWTTFTTNDAYKLETEVSRQFPGNRNIRPKIRQQLQVLRDMGILDHVQKGLWRIASRTPAGPI